MKKILFCMIGVLFIGFFMMMPVNADTKVAVTLENCEPGTWVGMVQWIDNKKGYKDLPEAEIKHAGKLTVMLEPGEYAITHYRPSHYIKMSNGRVLIIPSKIIEFRDVVVTKAVTFSFGCKWNMKGAT
jgi:hypothetical protein